MNLALIDHYLLYILTGLLGPGFVMLYDLKVRIEILRAEIYSVFAKQTDMADFRNQSISILSSLKK